jgi:hypothetical protein
MANTAQQQLRSRANNSPLSLRDGQLAFSYKSGKLFIGDIGGNPIYIGGNTLVQLANTAYELAISANTIANAAYVAANNVFPQIQPAFRTANGAYAQANSANNLAQSSFNKANAANDLATSGFGQANAATISAQAAFNRANLAGSLTFAVSAYDTANAGVNSAQSAYNKANSANILAQSAHTRANAANNLAQSGYNQANAATDSAQSAYERANGVLIIQGVNTTQNTRIGSLENLMTGAYTAANVGANFVQNGGTVANNATFSKDVNITGNLYVLGTSTTLQTTTVEVGDSLLVLANNNTVTDAIDIGFVGKYKDGNNQYTGLFREPTLKEYIFFKGYTPTISSNNLIDGLHPSFQTANVISNYFKGNLISDIVVVKGLSIEPYVSSAYGAANAALIVGSSAFQKGNSAFAFAQNAYDGSNNVLTYAQAGFDKANGFDSLVNSAYARANAADSLATSAYVRANAATNSASGAWDKGNTTGVFAGNAYNQANAANNLAQSAYNQANTAAGNISYALGVNVAQNTVIAILDNFAVSAYNQANAATDSAQAAYNKANSSPVSASFIQANAAFEKANSANVLAQAAFNKANTGTNAIDGWVRGTSNAAYIHANAAFDFANTMSTGSANDSAARANILSGAISTQAAFNKANTAYTTSINMQAVNDSQNTSLITLFFNTAATDSLAVGAYAQANTANARAFSTVLKTGDTMTGTLTVAANAFLGSATGNVYTSHLLPAANAVGGGGYDLGSPTRRWRKLYISGNTIDLGGALIGAETGSVSLTSDTGASFSVSGTAGDTQVGSDNIFASSNTPSFNTTTGAIVSAGGAGIVGNTYIGENLIVFGNTFTGNLYVTGTSNFGNNASRWNVGYFNYMNASSITTGTVTFTGDGTTQRTASAPWSYSNASFELANTASGNTIYTQGVDVTQNTRIAAVDNFVSSAYILANATNQYAQSGYAKANAATNSAQSAYDQANATNQYATSGYARANAAINSAQAGYDQANATNQYATSGFAKANAATNSAQAGYDQANAATNSASTAYNRANLAFIQANSAFAVANASVDSVQSAYNKANSAYQSTGGTISGSVVITGNLAVYGNSTILTTTSLQINDSLIFLANNNYTTDALDIGFVAHYNDIANAHTGLFRDASEKEYIFFDNYTPEILANNEININDASFRRANVQAQTFKGNVIASYVVANNINLLNYASAGFAKTNAAFEQANVASTGYEQANAATNSAQAAYFRANGAFIKANAAFGQANNATDAATNAQLTADAAINSAQFGFNRANGAFIQANAAFGHSNTTLTFAQAGYDQANAANNLAQSAYDAANNQPTTQAYSQANAATVSAQTGFNKANSANVLAQAAFDRANTDVTNINLGINTLLGDSEGKTVPYFTVMANGRVSTVGMAVNTQLFANTGQITTNTSFGRIQVGLAPIANSVAGTYTAANLQVDQYGRVVSVSSNTSIATGLANAIRTYNYAGTLTVNLGSKRLYITNPAAIVSIQFNLVTAGTTATSIAVKKNGIVINNTTLNAGISNLTTTPYIPVTTNDYLTIDILTAGTGATDLYATFTYI